MRNVLPIALVALLCVTTAHAQSNGIREVTASDRTLITLNTKVRFTTMLVLPDGEDVVDIICGDRENWVISAAANIAHVKPAKETAQTNLNLVTTSGAIYSFLLIEGKSNLSPDLKVYVTGGTPTATAGPKYYTADVVRGLEQDVRNARDAVSAAEKLAARTVADGKAQYPLGMQFAYDVPYTKPFLIRSIWHDGTFTYIKTDARELPALYEMKDGQPAMVNFTTPRPDTYVVPKVLESGYFVLGKQRLAFQQRTGHGE